MHKIEFDDKLNSIFGVRFSSEESYRDVKSAVASSSYEGFKPKVESIRIICDVVEGRLTREQLIENLKTGSLNER